jgi:RHS repeat-associated protein
VRYAYDALGRRLYKHSNAKYIASSADGSGYARIRRAELNQQYGCGFTLYGWDGDQLAWESRQGLQGPDGSTGRTTHYLYEPGTFVPLAQAVRHAAMRLLREPVWEGEYDWHEDPLWAPLAPAQPFDALAHYQCDHLGTPQELTDASGEVAWSAHYRASGLASEVISQAATKAGIANPLRFQGQYFDHETRLHYNRHRYYDPHSGRFVSKDPIGLAGGLNLHQYAANAVEWVDPLGLEKYIPAPKSLPGFTDAVRVKPKTVVQGGGGLRKRWKLPNGCICEWDSQHGEIEMYNKRGKHLGAFDPSTGSPMPGKNADPRRSVEP